MQCFVVQSEEIEGRLDPYFYKPEFIKIARLLDKFECKRLKDIAIDIKNGTTPTGGVFETEGIPYFRSQDFTLFDFEIKQFITPEFHKKLLRSKIKSGDVLIAVVGATLGVIGYVPDEINEANINQNVARVRIKDNSIDSKYLAIVLASNVGQKQLLRNATITTQAYLNNQQLEKIRIPFCPLPTQNQIVQIMQSAYNQKKQKEAEARRLLDSIDGYVLDELGIKLPEFEDKKCFVVDVEELSGILSPHFFVSKPKDEKGFVELKSIAEINPSRKINNLTLDTIVPYVGLPETDNFKVKNILERPYKEVKGRNIIKKVDILFARIEPSIFNKKYIFVDDLKDYTYAFTSTEFYIVKARKNVNPEFLFYMFYTTPVYNQVIGKTTGSTGRRRLDKGVFETLLIPLPPLEIQNKIAEEVKRRISEAERLKTEATNILEEAKKQVEEMILEQ